MSPPSRRSILELGGVALGTGLGGCLGAGGSDPTSSPTDSPTQSETSRAECQSASSDRSWKTSGSWHVDVAVSNDDDVSRTVTVEGVHHGSEPFHHAESTPCQSPEKYVTAFERAFDFPAGESRTFTNLTLELWESWIDDYTVQVRIEDADTTPRGRVFAYERGAKAVVGADTYEQADFYVRDGAERRIGTVISNGTPHTTPHT